MTTPRSAHGGPTHYDDVVGVEVTIDGILVIADRLNLMDFPVALGIRLNIPQLELRDIVWEQVARDLTAQGVLDIFGEPHPEVAAMVDTLRRADRTLEGRWWRRDVGGKIVRFVVRRQWYPHKAWLVLAIYTASAIVALISVGATEGVRRVSPVTKRILELADGAAIAAVIPLLLWIASVYDVLRNLRF